jgi:hypothetical protein
MSELNDWKILPQNLPLVGWDLGLHFPYFGLCLVGLDFGWSGHFSAPESADFGLHQRAWMLVHTSGSSLWSTQEREGRLWPTLR